MNPRRLFIAVAVAASALAGPAVVGHASTPTSPAPSTATPKAPVLVSPITVVVTPKEPVLKLSDAHDYNVVLPTSPTKLSRGVAIVGGHNVIMNGGFIDVPDASAKEAANENDRRGLYLEDQTGVVYVHDVHMTGELTEGIDLDEPGKSTTVVIDDVLVDPISGYSSSHHPDLLQTWAGPSRLYVDGFTGTSSYQGFFLEPNDLYSGPAPVLFALRNVQIDVSKGAYALWRPAKSAFPLTVANVQVDIGPSRSSSRNLVLWPKPSTGDLSWTSVTLERAETTRDVLPTAEGARGVTTVAPAASPRSRLVSRMSLTREVAVVRASP